MDVSTLLLLIVGIAITSVHCRQYELTFYTANVNWAGTGSSVFVVLYGDNGNSHMLKLPSTKANFQVGGVDNFLINTPDYGDIQRIKVCQDWKGKIGPSWYLKKEKGTSQDVDVKNQVTVKAEKTPAISTFIVDKWLEHKKPKSICVIALAIEKEQQKCGKTFGNPRVINGHNSRPHQWGWQAQIQNTFFDGLNTRNRHWCGGTLIHPQYVLTAAHCVYGVDKYKLTVVLGEHDLTRNEGTEQTFYVDNVIIHPSYGIRSKAYDIALIKLKKTARLNSNIQLACLPRFNEIISAGKNCMLTGWGKMTHPGKAASILQQAQLPTVSNAQCQKLNGHIANIKGSMFCAGGNMKSGCHGDSGGPFVCPRSDGRYVVHGAVSWGSHNCQTTGSYTVLSRVSLVLEWIYSLTYSSYVNY